MDSNKKWPAICGDDVNFTMDNIDEHWLGVFDRKEKSIEEIAKQCFLPIETVLHAIASRYFDVGEVDCSIKLLKHHLKDNHDAELHNVYLRCLLASPSTDLEQFKNESSIWNKRYGKNLVSNPDSEFANIDLSKDKRLTIGVLCGYATSTLFDVAFSPLFNAIDSKKFKCVLFNVGAIDDSVVKNNFDTCIQLPVFSSKILEEAIKSQNIDILIDLNGRFRMDNPIDVLLKRLVPVQISYGNMQASYSLDCIQYILSDKYTLRAEDEKYYTEKVYRFRNNVMGTFKLPDFEVSKQPVLESPGKPFIFGSFNAMFKLNSEVLETWCKILIKVPNSKLLLKAGGMESPRIQKRLIALIKKYKLDDRIVIEGFSPLNEMLDRYKVIDLALNTFPYSGGTTTVYALWNGIPSLTLSRDGMVQSGGGEGIIAEVGFEKFVANTVEQYIDKAVYFANNPKKLEKIRIGMRQRLQKSARFNPKVFAKDFEYALRDIWEDWVQNAKFNRTNSKEPELQN